DIALSVHLSMPEGHPGDAFLEQLGRELHDRFAIEHATIQIEIGCEPCKMSSHE
ncbi:MAG: cation transporter, partial [Gallionella sp.]|nr:cation transporter [Gallionella sp.]